MADGSAIKGELLPQHHEAWRRFREAVTAVEDRLGEATSAGWTAKEMLGHMGFWDEAIEPVVVAMFRGGELRDDWAFSSGYEPVEGEPWPRAVVHNAREAAWAAERPDAEVLERIDRAHARAAEILEGLTVDEWATDRYQHYVREKTGHYDEHRAELEAIAARAPTR